MSFKLNISGQSFEFFNQFVLNLKYDSIASTFSANVYFNPENPIHVNLFRPYTYRECTIEFNGKLIFTGVMLATAYNDSSTTNYVTIAGYSKGGIIEDCEIPISLYPLQSDGRTITQIATRLLNYFGLKTIIDPSVQSRMNRVLSKSTANEKQSVKSYLAELTNQVNVVMSHNEFGDIVFTQAKTKSKPILDIDSDLNSIPATALSLACNGQAMHRQITAIKEASSDGGNAGQSSVINPFCNVEKRNKVIIQSSGDDNTTQEVARNFLSEQLRSIQLGLSVNQWTDLSQDLITPNKLISVKSKRLYLTKKTNFFIESVTFSGNSGSEVAELKCVLPSVYDNSTPINIFL
jgi:prophage tail gpP-like protein